MEGRVGQRKLWGIVGLAKRYPAQCVDAACAQALEQGIYSYKQVQILAERSFDQAMAALATHPQLALQEMSLGIHRRHSSSTS